LIFEKRGAAGFFRRVCIGAILFRQAKKEAAGGVGCPLTVYRRQMIILLWSDFSFEISSSVDCRLLTDGRTSYLVFRTF